MPPIRRANLFHTKVIIAHSNVSRARRRRSHTKTADQTIFSVMKTQCLLRGNKYHTTAWVEAEATKLGLRVEIPELGGVWEIVEIYPYRLTDKQLKTHDALMAH